MAASVCQAQTPQERYEAFKKQAQQQYESFRTQANRQYADFIKEAWQRYNANEPIPNPFVKPVPPEVVPEDDKQKEHKDEPKPYEEVVVVEPPKPQPQPIEPVAPPKPVVPKQETVSTLFYGTRMQCTLPEKPHVTLANLSEKGISVAWTMLSSGQCDALLAQCLALRDRYRLSDWGYIQLLDSMAQACTTGNPDEATLLMAWLYCQSGYKMRLARSGGRLYMLFASSNVLYDYFYYTFDGENFYPYRGAQLKTLNVCRASFPKEQSMTLKMASEPGLDKRVSDRRTLQSKRYPNIKATVSVNRNLIDFYDHYPNGAITDDFGTRWAMYANTPLSDEVRQSLYPQLRSLLANKSKLQATEELLNFVQTAFVYEYDDKVWGGDRAFFAEETLYYPFADCEDRSILFSRLVRDLLGLKVVLLYYPGHLATAVRFEGQQPSGDYLDLSDGRYYISDPTYIGASIGMSMPQLRNEKIKVIVLQ